MYKEDTIAAVATPPGEGGIGVVRISGPDAERIAREIFARSGGKNGALRSHVLHHGTIRDPKTRAVLDEVLLTIMRKPHSYTGEEVVEIHCHGGPFLVRQLLEVVLSRGARHAEPGEFTRRAFLNGRLDLAQAEGILDLIRARTEKGAKLALGQLQGELSNCVGALREELIDVLVQVEAAIDFSEEDIELMGHRELKGKIERLCGRVLALVASYEWGRLFREGARVCIVGRPNVGKSSLLNALLGEERAIVTEVPGTTRDVIEEGVNLGGLPVVLWDTAGIRETKDQVERIGVDFSMRRLEAAHACLLVLDGSAALDQEDRFILETIRERRGIVVINKADLSQVIDINGVETLAPGKVVIQISAKEGYGIDGLKSSLRALLVDVDAEPDVVLTNVRHKAALEQAAEALEGAIGALDSRTPPEMVAVELQAAQEALGEIIGIVTSDDILERIFSDFCVGK
jgi:tRNA modification GTPase